MAGEAEFAGDFETHATVAAIDVAGVAALQRFSASQELKCLHIVLPRGACVSQPMLTWRGRGELSAQIALASQRTAQLAAAGFPVCRIKIEAAPGNRGIPQHDVEAQSTRYFESHVKLRLDAHEDTGALIALAQRHAAHVSRNALRERTDGSEERFVTQRCGSGGAISAQICLQALLRALAAGGYTVLRSELEYVVHDSNRALDAGWISED